LGASLILAPTLLGSSYTFEMTHLNQLPYDGLCPSCGGDNSTRTEGVLVEDESGKCAIFLLDGGVVGIIEPGRCSIGTGGHEGELVEIEGVWEGE